MGWREDREFLQSTWMVLEPRTPGTPFRRKDIEDSAERPMQMQDIDRNLPRRIARAVTR
jgi:hypothetical protein